MYVLLVTKKDTDKKENFILAKKQEMKITCMTNKVTPNKIYETVYKTDFF